MSTNASANTGFVFNTWDPAMLLDIYLPYLWFPSMSDSSNHVFMVGILNICILICTCANPDLETELTPLYVLQLTIQGCQNADKSLAKCQHISTKRQI